MGRNNKNRLEKKVKISQKCEKGRQELIIHHVLIKVQRKIQDAKGRWILWTGGHQLPLLFSGL